MNKIKCFALLLLLLPSCNQMPSNCKVYAIDILRLNPKKVYIANRNKNVILGISDYGRDKTKAGAYYFFPNGVLQYYRFFETDSAYDYEEEYDQAGKLVKMTDQPLVDVRVREVNRDSAIFECYLFALHKSYGNFKVSTNYDLSFDKALNDDTTYSNMKVTSIGISTKGQIRFKVFIFCDYVNECTGQKMRIKDTLSLIKNPRLNRED